MYYKWKIQCFPVWNLMKRDNLIVNAVLFVSSLGSFQLVTFALVSCVTAAAFFILILLVLRLLCSVESAGPNMSKTDMEDGMEYTIEIRTNYSEWGLCDRCTEGVQYGDNYYQVFGFKPDSEVYDLPVKTLILCKHCFFDWGEDYSESPDDEEV